MKGGHEMDEGETELLRRYIDDADDPLWDQVSRLQGRADEIAQMVRDEGIEMSERTAFLLAYVTIEMQARHRRRMLEMVSVQA
jgi:hypothetical protein